MADGGVFDKFLFGFKNILNPDVEQVKENSFFKSLESFFENGEKYNFDEKIDYLINNLDIDPTRDSVYAVYKDIKQYNLSHNMAVDIFDSVRDSWIEKFEKTLNQDSSNQYSLIEMDIKKVDVNIDSLELKPKFFKIQDNISGDFKVFSLSLDHGLEMQGLKEQLEAFSISQEPKSVFKDLVRDFGADLSKGIENNLKMLEKVNDMLSLDSKLQNSIKDLNTSKSSFERNKNDLKTLVNKIDKFLDVVAEKSKTNKSSIESFYKDSKGIINPKKLSKLLNNIEDIAVLNNKKAAQDILSSLKSQDFKKDLEHSLKLNSISEKYYKSCAKNVSILSIHALDKSFSNNINDVYMKHLNQRDSDETSLTKLYAQHYKEIDKFKSENPVEFKKTLNSMGLNLKDIENKRVLSSLEKVKQQSQNKSIKR